jgi:hypothetical protein
MQSAGRPSMRPGKGGKRESARAASTDPGGDFGRGRVSVSASLRCHALTLPEGGPR